MFGAIIGDRKTETIIKSCDIIINPFKQKQTTCFIVNAQNKRTMVGSIYEFDNHRSKDFPLFGSGCYPTDDSIMTIAVAKAILENDGKVEGLSEKTVEWMQKIGRQYHNKVYLMNAVDYGVPQNRPRLIMISTKLPDDEVQRTELKRKLETYYQENDITDKAYISTITKELIRILEADPVCYGKSAEF